MFAASSTDQRTDQRTDPTVLLRELLAEDKRDGIPWSAEQFAHTVMLVAREHASRSWARMQVDLYLGWKGAYLNVPSALAGLSVHLLLDDGASGGRDHLAEPAGL